MPRIRPSLSATRYISVTCEVNVLVAATPISSPARVNSTESHSRVICDPITLVIASTWAPRDLASFIAASVSIVSPDCAIAITSVCSSITARRYRHSLAMSDSQGIRAHSSSR